MPAGTIAAIASGDCQVTSPSEKAPAAEPFVVDAPAGVSAAENEPLSDSVAAAIVSKR